MIIRKFRARWVAALAAALLVFRGVFAATPEVTAPTEEACAEFGRWLVARMEAGEYKEITRHFDPFAFVAIATAGLDVEDKERGQIAAGLRSTFAAGFERDLATFDSSRFLRVQTRGEERRVLLRLLKKGGGANYMALVCARRADGGVKWVDVFSYLSGEKLSESTRRLLLPALAEQKKSLFEKLSASENAFLKNLPSLQRGLALIRDEKHEEAHALLQNLPSELRQEKFVLLVQMRAAQNLSEEVYLKTLSAIQAIAPDDGSLDLALIDGYFLRKDYPGALQRIEALQRELGGDAYLDYLKGNTHLAAKNYPAAIAEAQTALASEPNLFEAYDTLLSVSLERSRFADTTAVLLQLETRHPGIDMRPAIADGEEYAAYRASDAYRDWLARRALREAELPGKTEAEKPRQP